MLVYVCSPYRGLPPYGDEKRSHNLEKTIGYCSEVVQAGYTPVAPHLYFATFLNDDTEAGRQRGMEMGRKLLLTCTELWVFGNEISEGMQAEIKFAKENDITVIYLNKQSEVS